MLKFLLLYRSIRWPMALKVGLPAFAAAFAGAGLLFHLEEFSPVVSYSLFGKKLHVLPVKLVIAVVMIVFVILELLPVFKKMSFSPRTLPLGGLLTGFFGGLSGHQGALRTMFLLKCGLEKEAFIATGVAIAAFVDVSRLSVYWGRIMASGYQRYGLVMLAAVMSAFAGILLGKKILKKMTFVAVQAVITVMLVAVAVLLGMGIILAEKNANLKRRVQDLCYNQNIPKTFTKGVA